MIRHTIFAVSLIVSVLAGGPPMGGGGAVMYGAGQSAGSGCPSDTSCSLTGSSNYVNLSNMTLSNYDSATGKFRGSLTTNSCPKQFGNFADNTAAQQAFASPQCIYQTIPAYTGPTAAGLRGTVGWSWKGVQIYGPMEAGFTLGQACSNGKGTCDAGMDVPLCVDTLEKQCGTSALTVQMFLDTCGGHASPYHYHADLRCDYSSAAGNHAPMVGVALDGYGIYGLGESGTTAPTDLDYCGGHFGNVPATTINGVTYPAATNVYHYHTQDKPPYTLGCFGPVNTLTACKALYSTCEGTTTTYCTSQGQIAYDNDCPCFRAGVATETYNYVRSNTSSCSTCKGSCTAPVDAATTPSPVSALAVGLGVGLGVGIPVVVGAIILAYCCCCKKSTPPKASRRNKVSNSDHMEDVTVDEETGEPSADPSNPSS